MTLQDYVNFKLTHADKVAEAEGYPLVMGNCKKHKKMKQLEICGNSVQSNIPGYQQLEYIEATGTQYIDTGFVGKTGLEVSMKFMLKDSAQTEATYLLGSYINTTTNNRIYAPYIAAGGYIGMGSGGYYISDYVISLDTIYEVNTQLLSNKISCTINEENIISEEGEFNVDGEGSLYLFSRHLPSHYKHDNFKGRIYYCKIWDNDTLVRDFIPCYRIADGVIGMYDLVNDVFYTNAGTGSFIKGGNGTPTPDAPVEVVSVGELVTDTTDANYGKYKIPVVQRGKNMCTLHNPLWFDNCTYENGVVTQLVADTATSTYFKLNAYYIGGGVQSVANYYNISLGLKYFKFTLTKDVNYFRFGINGNARDTLIGLQGLSAGTYLFSFKLLNTAQGYFSWCDMQIEKIEDGMNSATPYEPYVEPVTTNIFLDEPLRKVGAYADYIDFKENKVVRNIGVGTSNTLSKWKDAGNYNCGITWGLKNCNYRANTALCTHFLYNYEGLSNGVYFNFIDGIYWYFDKTLFPTQADADRWINSRKADEIPLRFHYVLITPIEEPITCELPKLTAKTTIIEVDTSLAPSNIYGKYIKK